MDLISSEQADVLEKRIRAANAIAKIYRAQNCELKIDAILGVKAFNLKNALSIDPKFLSEDAHEHDVMVTSISMVDTGSVSSDKLTTWLNQLVQAQGQNIFRMQGT